MSQATAYKIPENFEVRIRTSNIFTTVFKNFLDDMFPKGWTYGKEITTNSGKEIISVDGTTGWYECLMNAFKACGMKDIGEYYTGLRWDESDLFDYEIEKMVMGTVDEDYDSVTRRD